LWQFFTENFESKLDQTPFKLGHSSKGSQNKM